MAEQNTHTSYSAEDIERYLKGKMSAKEMHDVEKAALQDPFLADAIEGFSNTSFEESHKHLNEITAALQTRKEETKVVPITSKSFYWWRVAAIIIFVTGIGAVSWYIIGLNNAANKNEIAQVKENKSKVSDTAAVKELKKETVKNDSLETLLAQNGASRSQQKQKKKNNYSERQEKVTTSALTKAQRSTEKNADAIVADSFVAENKDATANTSSLSAPLTYDTLRHQETLQAVNAKHYPGLNNNALNNFSGRVTNNNNQPVAFATIRANNKAATTDTNGYFKLQAPDSVLNVTVSSAGFVSANKQLKSYTTNNISMQPDKNALSQVAVTAYAAKKQGKENFADSAYPSGGWQSFREYVYKKLRKPLDTLNDEEIVNSVQIEFSIDGNGLPYNFTVLKSLNDETASKVIEILKEGPRWIATSKNKKGRVTIQF